MGLYFVSFCTEVALVLVAIAAYLVMKAKRRYKYFEERNIKFIEPTIPIGSMARTMVGLEHPGAAHTRFYKALKGERIGGVFQAMTPVLIVRDPELVHKVLIKDFAHFCDRGFRTDPETNPLEDHLFFLTGDRWRTMRHKLAPTFTSGKLKWMYPLMTECCNMLMKLIEEKVNKDNVIEVTDTFACFTTDVIGSCAFGYEPSAIKDPNSDFRVWGRRAFRPNLKDVLIGALRFAWPDLFFKLKIKTVDEKMSEFFFKVVGDAFEHRLKTGEKRNDVIQLLLQLREKGEVEIDPKEKDDEDDLGPDHVVMTEKEETYKLKLTDKVLTAQAFVFWLAGFETSATTMSFTLYQLSKYPKIQDRVREEVREMKRKHGGVTYQAVKDMVYLDACLKETLRLCPPLPVLNRECTKTYHLDDGRVIEKGQQMVIPTIAIHHDPDVFPQPEVFKPERFAPGASVAPGTYFPFGDGPRVCIGQRFAWVEAKLGLANILDKYTIEICSKTKNPMNLNNRSFVLQPKDGIWLKFNKAK